MPFKYPILLLSCFFMPMLICQAQNSSDRESIYTSTNTFEIFTNKESGFSNEPVYVNRGFGFELNSFHGIFLFRSLAISIGVGIAFNVNEDFKGLPVVGDVKWYFSEYGEDSAYILINAGRNIEIGSFLPGQSSKLGIGYAAEEGLVVELFIKSKAYESSSYYGVLGIGLSIGIKL
ncbi:MAG: hypothetical protein ABI295_11100 [Xanthomarina sp.]